MASSLGTGFMAVFAVSGSVVFIALQAHKRLLSKFMKRMEFEIKHSSDSHSPPGKEVEMKKKKKVRFANDVKECSCSGTVVKKGCDCKESLEGMPENWQAMYKGIIQSRNLRASY